MASKKDVVEDTRTDEEILANKNKLELYHFPIAEHLLYLNASQKGELLQAIMDYDMRNQEPCFKNDKLLDMAFSSVRNQLDVSRDAYIKKSRNRSYSGRIGGINSGNTRRLLSKQNEANESNASTTKQDEPNEADKIRQDKRREDKIKKDIIVNDNTSCDSPTLNTINEMLDEDFQSVSKDAVYSIVEYYLNNYEAATGEEHPPIRQNELDKLIGAIPEISTDEGKVILNADKCRGCDDKGIIDLYEGMINEYFIRNQGNKDALNIMRFFNGSTRASLL